MPFELNILIGGEAGQGIQTIGHILGKTFAAGGLQVFADQDYESRIRGGHNFYRIRVSDSVVTAQSDLLDILVALDSATLDLHKTALKSGGLVIADSAEGKSDWPLQITVSLEKMALEAADDKIMANSVAIGIVMGLLQFPFAVLSGVIKKIFSKSAVEVAENNSQAAKAGYDYAQSHKPAGFNLDCSAVEGQSALYINGNEAIALGALAGGCKFAAVYPMTPITSILEFLADKGRKFDLLAVQPEDEIAAINIVIGAACAGVRAMTATSGSGFALMVEALGLAGMTETPAVIILGQRPGPACGLPTRTEQGELLFAIHAGTGEFPKIVLAPANAEEAFYLTAGAFNLAERFQLPVIILTDTHLANSYSTVPVFDLDSVKIERGEWLTDSPGERYLRYQLTDSGISPRLQPGLSAAVVSVDADEHDEEGHLTESARFRTEQVSKRLKKYAAALPALNKPRFDSIPGAQINLIGWGSTYGVIREAAAILRKGGRPVNHLHFSEIWPFPADFVKSAMQSAPQNVVIENNGTSQLAYLIRAQTGLRVNHCINKWDGRPVSAQFILDRLEKEVL
jgi:2-oxoglutarate ferredoxin oxidoreductase subunit alpha